jgi:hypothetical protein
LDNSHESPVVSPFVSSAKFPVKRRGEIAELAFLLRAICLGFGVAKPWGDGDRFDFAQGRLLRFRSRRANQGRGQTVAELVLGRTGEGARPHMVWAWLPSTHGLFHNLFMNLPIDGRKSPGEGHEFHSCRMVRKEQGFGP